MSVQLRLLAKAPGSLRPSVLELAAELAELAEPGRAAGLDGLADPVLDDAAAVGDVAEGDPIAAETAGGGPPPLLFEVHALSKASATHAAVAIARLWR
jgi:hypothetical protein